MCGRRYVGEKEVIEKNMVFAKRKDYTVEYIEALPEGERVELIDGQLYFMATPTSTHQRLLAFLLGNIWSHVKNEKGGCQVFPAPFAVYLDRDDRTYLEPDLLVVCDKEKIDEKGCHGAPDFVAEIISPSSRSTDYLLKTSKYQAAGVREYWILDTERNLIQVHDFPAGTVYNYGFGDKIPVGIFENLKIDFSEF